MNRLHESRLQLAEGIRGREAPARTCAQNFRLRAWPSIRSRKPRRGRCSTRKSPRTVPIAWDTFGIAREVAAIYRLPVKPLEPKLKESAEKAADATRVEIESPDLCGRYTARVLRGVKVQPSPDWLRQRLEAIGEKSINNVVDVTNYVMFELGQPLHAFDLDKLSEQRIVVRRARPGEKIRTLDGAERTLTKDMCVIADASRAVAIAGVMGGADTEIGFSTRNILIESAWFDPISVRRTSKALGLRTEASYRFERGADPEMAELASRRAAELIQQVAGGEILAGVVDVYPGGEAPLKIELSRAELLRVMGADVPDRDIEEILTALGFQPKRAGTGASAVMAVRAAVMAARRDPRDRPRRRSGAALWLRQISAAAAAGKAAGASPAACGGHGPPARAHHRARLSGNRGPYRLSMPGATSCSVPKALRPRSLVIPSRKMPR